MANQILPFCPTDTGTNLLSQGDYSVAADRTIGNQPGVASSKLVNKAIRQSSFIASQIAQFVTNKSGVDVLDDGATTKLLAQIDATFTRLAPIVYRVTASQTIYSSYYFFIAAGNATTGATYTNNGFTYTVYTTIVGGTILNTAGTGVPAASGTLTKSAGTGDATLTFYAVRAPLYGIVEACGGGGGGSSGGASINDGVAGGDTTFGGGAYLTAGGGGRGIAGGSVGAAATGNTVGAALQIIHGVLGGRGDPAPANSNPSASGGGGSGGVNPFCGGSGGGGPANAAAAAGGANTGAGGGGGGSTLTSPAGSGGSSGSYVKAMVPTPLASYVCVIGAGGAGGAGTYAGAAGGSGVIIYTLYFQ